MKLKNYKITFATIFQFIRLLKYFWKGNYTATSTIFFLTS